MTIKWGDPIECNGVRPDWLRGRVTCDLKTAAGWESPAYYESENEAEDWAWSHRPGVPNVTHIRLPAEHPAYVALARVDRALAAETPNAAPAAKRLCRILRGEE